MTNPAPVRSDVVLIGGGIMSATLATFLREVAPEKSITVYEKLAAVALESSNEWNNAGTGHAALCELNYTVEQADGSVACGRAIAINEKFQLSLQMWAYLVEKGHLTEPESFIRRLPHISFVEGEKDVAFLKKRFEGLKKSHLFDEMEFADDMDTLSEWMPLMMQKREQNSPRAATRMASGTDVNFGSLTRQLFAYLQREQVQIHTSHAVKDLQKTDDGWLLTVQDLATHRTFQHLAKFVFIGCGGGSLPLLQKSGIPESQNVGGFPVSGLFMVCRNPEVVNQHHAKVYGKAKVGAPPMSVPHLDTRYIDGKKSLLFGPFAGFSPKFLKAGSYLDFPLSFKPNNFITMIAGGLKNIPLTHYLIKQVLLSKEDRMMELREFVPTARNEDWDLVVAGQRVQVIKDSDKEKGVLQFGTEVIHSADGSLAALLGASPGASTSVDVMLDVLKKCFPNEISHWRHKLKEMIPSYGFSLRDEKALYEEIKPQVEKHLGLDK